MISFYSLIFCLGILIFFVISLYCGYRRKFSNFSKFPIEVWMDWRFIYETFILRKHSDLPLASILFQRLIDLCQKHEVEGICVIQALKPILYVFGEESVKIFASDSALTEKPRLYKAFEILGPNGILISNGNLWKKQRKLMNPAFYPSTMRDNIPLFNEHALVLVQELSQLENHTANDTEEIIRNSMLKLFFEAALGIRADTMENERKIIKLTDLTSKSKQNAVSRMTWPWLNFNVIQRLSSYTKDWLVTKKEVQDIAKEILEEIKEAVLSRQQSLNTMDSDHNSKRKSFGEILIAQHLSDPSFTMEDLWCQLLHFTFAGYDTVSHALTWCFWLLGHHPEVQEQMYAELTSVTTESFQYEDLPKLVYTECVIKETLRLYPAAPIFARYLKKDYNLGEYTVPKGTTIAFFNYVLHRNSKLFPNPETFDPSRFAADASKIKPWTYIPFAEGARYCIGRNFALLEMKIFLAHVIRNFRIVSLDKKENIALTWEIVLRNAKPLRIQFLPR